MNKFRVLIVLLGIVALIGYTLVSQSSSYFKALLDAGVAAEANFVAAHPYNAHVLNRMQDYRLALAAAQQRNRPVAGWSASECETQTFDHRDYEQEAARARTTASWPISMFLPPMPVAKAAAPYTETCQLERDAFASNALQARG